MMMHTIWMWKSYKFNSFEWTVVCRPHENLLAWLIIAVGAWIENKMFYLNSN